jgi:hypothetical protein
MALPPVYLTSSQIRDRYGVEIEANVRVDRRITPQDEKIRQLVVAGRRYYDAPTFSAKSDAYREMQGLRREGYHLIVDRY